MQTMMTGDKLTAADQHRVLARYVHRFTGEHKPQWATKPWKDGQAYPVQHATDAEWLQNTRFHVRANGELDDRFKSCESNPTWPLNPELRK